MKKNSESNYYKIKINGLIEELRRLKQLTIDIDPKNEVAYALLKVRKTTDKLISLNDQN